MSRFQRPDFCIDDLDKKQHKEEKTRLIFDWWCDDKDRAAFFDKLVERRRPVFIYGRMPVENDPCPPRDQPVKQGHAKVALITCPKTVGEILEDPENFSSIPYAELGGASFMLALDPGPGSHEDGHDWHGEQREVGAQLLASFNADQLAEVAKLAVQRASVVSLADSVFDLAELAEQAALRYFELLFGFAGADHAILEDAARRGYRALQYLIVGRHFVSEGSTIPLAQQAMSRVAKRTSELVQEYANLARAPRKPTRPGQPKTSDKWPEGVQPWDENELSDLGAPILARIPALSGRLSGQDLANVVSGLVVGTVGNVQTALCLMVQDILRSPAEFYRLRDLHRVDLLREVRRLVAKNPPIAFLPRRTRKPMTIRDVPIGKDVDCILVLRSSGVEGCPWGAGATGHAKHVCLGRAFSEPLLVELLYRVLRLPDLDQLLDRFDDDKPVAPERLWGFGCTRYRLRYRRYQQRVQQPLIVVMPIKTPVAENANRLRGIIRNAAPRIQQVLDQSGMVHVAWFEFMEGDTKLALRTVYDGDFDTYIMHFATEAGELFDLIFDCIDPAPPMPVADYPDEFVEMIRRYNRTPLAGYFYSAYPQQKVPDITQYAPPEAP